MKRRWTHALPAAALMLGLYAAGACAAAPGRALRAKAAILVEGSTGDVAFARAARTARPIASTTKLMTALLVLEQVGLDDVLVAPAYHAGPAESTIGLRRGERMSVRDLLRALLLASANDAAAALAQDTAGSRRAFVAEMNARARELGLASTHYANPVGLDQRGNYSSAADLVKLTRILLRNPFFRETVDLQSARLGSGSRPRTVVNRNRLVRSYRFVDGVKTGHTLQAGYVLVGAATRRGVSVVSAVLGEPSEAARDADTLALLRYGLGQYRLATLLRSGQVVGSERVKDHFGEYVPLLAARTLRRAIRRGRRVSARLVVPATLDGPLPARRHVGYLDVRVGGRPAARIPVVTAAAVPDASLGARLTKPGTLVLEGALCVGAWLLARRLGRRRRNERAKMGTETA